MSILIFMRPPPDNDLKIGQLAGRNDALPMNGISRLLEGYSLSLNTSIYCVDAIKKSAYKFADRASVIINPVSESAVSVVFTFAGKHAESDPDQVISDFCNELLDQDLRERIKKETEPLRNLILAHVFSRTSLVDKDQP